MKRLRKPKEFCFTVVVFGGFILLFLAATSSAQYSLVTSTQQDLRYITDQYREIAADYLPGSYYEKAMNDLVLKVEAMSADESSAAAQYLKPFIPSMLANLQGFKDGLSGLNRPKRPSYKGLAAVEFPNAQYPNIQPVYYEAVFLPAAVDILSLPLGVAQLLTGFKFENWAPSGLNAIPTVCITSLDEDGNPVRTPDGTMMILRMSLQGAEALKEGANVIFEQVGEIAGVGGNLKWLTLVTTGLWMVEKIIYENIKECDAMISSAEAIASYQRLGHIHDDLENLSNKTDVAQGDLSSIKSTLANIETKLNTIIELLNTPQGLRPNFPIKR